MVKEALQAGRIFTAAYFKLLGTPNPNKPSTHASEVAHAVTEAVRRQDTEILQALLDAKVLIFCYVVAHLRKVSLLVQDVECSGGCGVGSVRKASPLAECLLSKNKPVTRLFWFC